MTDGIMNLIKEFLIESILLIENFTFPLSPISLSVALIRVNSVPTGVISLTFKRICVSARTTGLSLTS